VRTIFHARDQAIIGPWQGLAPDPHWGDLFLRSILNYRQRCWPIREFTRHWGKASARSNRLTLRLRHSRCCPITCIAFDAARRSTDYGKRW